MPCADAVVAFRKVRGDLESVLPGTKGGTIVLDTDDSKIICTRPWAPTCIRIGNGDRAATTLVDVCDGLAQRGSLLGFADSLAAGDEDVLGGAGVEGDEFVGVLACAVVEPVGEL